MQQWPKTMVPFIGTVNKILKVTRQEVRLYGEEVALDMHCQRSNLWIQAHQVVLPESEEEMIATVTFAAALQFVNLLFAYKEVLDDTEHS